VDPKSGGRKKKGGTDHSKIHQKTRAVVDIERFIGVS
jgi:hypothetical protein